MENKQTNNKINLGYPTNPTRRDFVKNIAVAGCAVLVANFAPLTLSCSNSEGTNQPIYKMLLVDYSRCTGCRTCEAICVSFNQRRKEHNESVPGIGNPYYSNIKVYHYNPDVDVPNVCAMCPDSPCIKYCPVLPDPVTGKGALYRHDKTGAITNDQSRCTGCGSCAEACALEGTGVIVANPKTNHPQNMCTLCNGTPQCVKYCPYDALRLETFTSENQQPIDKSPERIANTLIQRFYSI